MDFNAVGSSSKTVFSLITGIHFLSLRSTFCSDRDQVEVACKGSFNVGTIRSTVLTGSSFKIMTSNGLSLYMRCLDEEEAVSWLDAIKKSKSFSQSTNTVPITGFAGSFPSLLFSLILLESSFTFDERDLFFIYSNYL